MDHLWADAPLRRRLVRGLLPGGALLGSVLVLAACGSGEPSVQQGQAIAFKARVPVEREFMSVYHALNQVSEQDVSQRYGNTRVCAASPGKQPDQVSYDIANLVNARNRKLTAVNLLPQLEKALKADGWKGFTPGYGSIGGLQASRYWTGSKGQFKVILQPETGNQRFFTLLAVAGPCVRVGSAFVAKVPLISERPPG